MPNESSDSVRIFWYNREEVRRALEQALKALALAHPEIEEAVLFGSFVRGDAVPGSDVDMLLVLRDSEKDFLARIPDYLPSHVPGGVDVFPYTREELRRMRSEGNPFIRQAFEQGRCFGREEILSGAFGL